MTQLGPVLITASISVYNDLNTVTLDELEKARNI